MGRLTLHPRIAPSSPASSPSGLARVERRDLGVVFKSPGTQALSPLFVTGILRTWAGHEPFCRREARFTIRPQGPTFNGHSAQRQRVIGSPGSGSSDMSV